MTVRSVTVNPPAYAWQTNPGTSQEFAVWELDVSTDGESWRTTNAGTIDRSTRRGRYTVHGRVNHDEVFYLVKWVPDGGGGFAHESPKRFNG